MAKRPNVLFLLTDDQRAGTIHALGNEEISTPNMDEKIRTALETEAAALGYEKVTWVKTGCVITCHGGPGAFGIVGKAAL